MTTSEVPRIRSPQRVVVGVDGLPASLQALQWALGYAARDQFARRGRCGVGVADEPGLVGSVPV